MDENSEAIEAILRGQEESSKIRNDDDVYGWKTVSYQKRNNRKPQPTKPPPEAFSDPQTDVFRPIEQRSEERRRQRLEAEAQREAAAIAGGGDARLNGEDDGSDVEPGENGGGAEDAKKAKVKKPKKPKVTVAEAAARIDDSDLSDFLADITVNFIRLL